MRGLKGRRYLVCGGGSGIGEATARRLHEEGASVVVADRSATAAERVAAELGCEYQQYEQADPASVERLFAAVARTGDLHGVALVAGVHPGNADLADASVSRFHSVHDVNAAGVLECLRRAAGLVVRDGTASLVVVGSVAGIRPAPRDAIYASSKAAAQAIARSVALELAPVGIRVNSVLPGWVITPLAVSQVPLEQIHEDAARVLPLARSARAEEVAGAVCFLLSDDSSYITASELLVDGGLAASGPT